MKVKIIYENLNGEGELALGLAIDQTLRRKFPKLQIDVVMKGKQKSQNDKRGKE